MCSEKREHVEDGCWCFPVEQHIGDVDIIEHNSDSELAEILGCLLSGKPIRISSIPYRTFKIAQCEVCGKYHLINVP